MTMCSPIVDKAEFTGAFCTDLLPTLNYGNVKDDTVDNYLQNMYLKYLSYQTNYVFFEKNYIWTQNFSAFMQDIDLLLGKKLIKQIDGLYNE